MTAWRYDGGRLAIAIVTRKGEAVGGRPHMIDEFINSP
jgi:hypothetical protein